MAYALGHDYIDSVFSTEFYFGRTKKIIIIVIPHINMLAFYVSV